MERRGVYLRVGGLILLGISLAVALIWFLGGARIASGTLFESYFTESVQGLEVGAPVKYRGVTIGRVTELGLVSAAYAAQEEIDPARKSYQSVFSRYEVDTSKIGRVPDTNVLVDLGLRSRVASQGITGLSYIELDFVDPARYPAVTVPWKPKGGYIPSMPSTFSQVQDAAQQVLAKLNGVDIERVATELTGLMTDLRTQLATGDVHQVLQEAAAALRSVGAAVQAADLPALTADLRRSSAAVRDTLEGERMQTLLSNAGTAADRLATAAARLPGLIASFQVTAQRVNSGTADIEHGMVPLLRDMQLTAANLRELTELLRRYPAQVLSQPPPRASGTAR